MISLFQCRNLKLDHKNLISWMIIQPNGFNILERLSRTVTNELTAFAEREVNRRGRKGGGSEGAGPGKNWR